MGDGKLEKPQAMIDSDPRTRWFQGRVWPWISFRINWMCALAVLAAMGVYTQQFVSDSAAPPAGQISVIWGLPLGAAVIGLITAKEFYERDREQREKEKLTDALAQLAASEAREAVLREEVAEMKRAG